VIEQSGLITFEIEGSDVRRLMPRIEGKPGVEHIAFFGAALHVSGHDRGLLEAALAPVRNELGLKLREEPPSLEDVFIYLQQTRGTLQ
jgi:ABC-2 type transport system ATP-binding protein